jgi:hypothetical protein
MAGDSYTTLFLGTGGDNVYGEDIGGSPVIKMPACKIHTGALGVDGGPLTPTNPLPVRPAGWASFPPVLTTGGVIQAAGGGRILRRLTAYNRHSAQVNIAVFNGVGTWGTSANLLDMFAVAANLAGNPRDYSDAGIQCSSGIYCLISTGLWTAGIAAPATGSDIWGLSA